MSLNDLCWTKRNHQGWLQKCCLECTWLCKLVLLTGLFLALNGCVLTKLVTVPMRVGGAVISVMPVAGNHVHDAIDGAADVVDDLPI